MEKTHFSCYFSSPRWRRFEHIQMLKRKRQLREIGFGDELQTQERIPQLKLEEAHQRGGGKDERGEICGRNEKLPI